MNVYLTGPTAGGKTGVGIALAELLDTEIISMDSMSVYRRMDIGTAKPTLAERKRIRHHLVDIRNPDEEYSVSDFYKESIGIAEEIRGKNKTPLFVGGTPLYLKAMLRGLFDGPPGDETIRARLQEFADSGGDLHPRLEAIDPETARRIHPNDVRRQIRAIEVYEITGKPISDFQTQFDKQTDESQHMVFVIDWDRDSINRRIDKRVDAMFAQRFLDEAKSLFSAPIGKTASQAVGYRELFDYFRGYHTLEAAIELIKIHSHQFAKRQRTWYRSFRECRFIEATEPLEPEKFAKVLHSHIFEAH